MTFYSWCIRNNKGKYLDLWNYDKNDITPYEVSYRDNTKKFYFKCEKGIHEDFLKGINNLRNSKDLICPRCNSFYQWCIDNNRQDIIDAWDKEKNIVSMDLVSSHSGKSFWFTFEYYSYLYPISYISAKDKDVDPVKKYYNSLGYYLIEKYGENGIKQYWSDKNKKSSFEIDKGSGKRVWFKCTKKDYHDDYQAVCYTFTSKDQCRCPMCAHKITHPLDSFAQRNISLFGENWVEEYWCDDNTLNPFAIPPSKNKTKVHIRCMNVSYHDFWITPAGYCRSKEGVCPCCKRKVLHPKDSLAGQMPSILSIWSNKNMTDPYTLSFMGHKYIWLKCEENIHSDYRIKISSYTYKKQRCPKCSALINNSSYQIKTKEYLLELGYNVLNEYECNIIPRNPKTNYPLPLDNEIPELKLIIEVNGKQHYELNGFHYLSANDTYKTPEEMFEYSKWKDKIKKEYVISQGYSYLELPYYLFDTDEYKKVIDKKIEEIKNQTSVSTAGDIWQQIS